MTATTKLEKKIVLKLFKDLYVDYNPSNLSKELDKTRVGAFKALHSLEEDGIVLGKDFGKARFFKVKLKDDYAAKNVETLLMEEAKPYERWKDEFKQLFKYTDVVIIFGSFVKNPKSANDIDILLIFNEKHNKKVTEIIKEKNELLTKKLHPIKQTITDFKSNLKKKDKVILNALKEGIVLQGYEKYVELIRHATLNK